MKTILFAATAFSLSIPVAVHAETPLSEVVVVGARAPQAVDRLGQQVSVVTAETLKARPAPPERILDEDRDSEDRVTGIEWRIVDWKPGDPPLPHRDTS